MLEIRSREEVFDNALPLYFKAKKNLFGSHTISNVVPSSWC